MKNTKELKEIAASLKSQHKLDSEDTLSILAENVGREFVTFSAKIASENDQDLINIAAKPVKKAINLTNDWLRNVVLDQLNEMSLTDAFKFYLADQTILGYDLVKENGIYSVVYNARVNLDFADLYKRLRPADYDGIMDILTIFADNLARFVLRDDKASVTRAAMSEHYVALRKKLGMTIPADKLSKRALARQLTFVVEKIFNQETVRMEGSDITFLCAALIQGKSVANKAGSYVMREEKTLLNLIFRAFYTRLNKLPYSFQTQTKAEKDPRSVKVDKKTNQPKADNVKATGKAAPVVVAEKVEKPAEEQAEDKAA